MIQRVWLLEVTDERVFVKQKWAPPVAVPRSEVAFVIRRGPLALLTDSNMRILASFPVAPVGERAISELAEDLNAQLLRK